MTAFGTGFECVLLRRRKSAQSPIQAFILRCRGASNRTRLKPSELMELSVHLTKIAQQLGLGREALMQVNEPAVTTKANASTWSA